MHRVRLSFGFEMAHRLDSAYSSACVDCIHGHSYKMEVLIQSKSLNEDMMVVDFGKIKSLLGEEVNRFDHAILLSPATIKAALKLTSKRISPEALQKKASAVFGKKVILCGYNPTAELMAQFFFRKFRYLASTEFKRQHNHPEIVLVRVQETDRGWAEYFEPEC